MKDIVTVKGKPAEIDYGLRTITHKGKTHRFDTRMGIYAWLTNNKAMPNIDAIEVAEQIAKKAERMVSRESFKLGGASDRNYQAVLEYTIKFLQDRV